MKAILTSCLCLFSLCLFSQGNDFENIVLNQTTSVKDQEETGACWAYAACSFLESELLRMNKGEYDLSEAFLVYYAYLDKALNYFLRQSKANFATGALSHDAIEIINKKGIVPNKFFKGQYLKDGEVNYFEMHDILETSLNSILKIEHPSIHWLKHFENLLISYLGKVPEQIELNDETITPAYFFESSGLNLQDYISLTSYTHHPYNSKFILEVPDNYSNGEFYNLPLDKLVEVIDTALLNGYTFIWDGDVSEPTFSTHNKGLAMLPKVNKQGKLIFEINIREIEATQELRQIQFQRLKTTDDHLMHCVGTAQSTNGTKFYIMKNSWGTVGPYDGYTYMSEAYLRMKTVSIMLNKKGILKNIKVTVN